MNPRDYQSEGIVAVEEAWLSYVSALLVMATGLGKTILFSHIIDRTDHGRTLVLAHREELIRQAANKIEMVTGEPCEVEMADERADGNMFSQSRVIVASKDTLHDKRLARFDPFKFRRLIIDEAHHAVAERYRRIIAHFTQNPDLRVLGVTATPDRLDEQALGKVFETCAFVYDIVDGINDGWLVPISQRMVRVESLDYSKIRSVAGDFNGRELAELMEYEENLHKVADPILRLARWKRTLVFAASVAHAERLAEIFNRHRTNCARMVSGKTPKDERVRILADYRKPAGTTGAFQFLVNVGVFTEGFDDPGIELVAIARPTESRALYAQMIGRGTRPLPGLVDGLESAEARRAAIGRSRKPCLEVLDLEGNAGKHKLITVADVLGGNYDDDIIERAVAKARQAGKPLDMLGAIEQAQRDRHTEKLREQELARQRREALKGKAEFTTRPIDPFDVLDVEPPRRRGWDHDEPASERQVAFLEKRGVRIDSLTKAKASRIIGAIKDRESNGKCTYKQAQALKIRGLDPNVTYAEAQRLLNQSGPGRLRELSEQWKARQRVGVGA